jgi:hypothetical protein
VQRDVIQLTVASPRRIDELDPLFVVDLDKRSR